MDLLFAILLPKLSYPSNTNNSYKVSFPNFGSPFQKNKTITKIIFQAAKKNYDLPALRKIKLSRQNKLALTCQPARQVSVEQTIFCVAVPPSALKFLPQCMCYFLMFGLILNAGFEVN